MKNNKKKIRIGKVELPDSVFDLKNVKFRVTMFLDLDLLDEIRRLAKAKRLPYQTFINQHLRECLMDGNREAQIRKIVRDELKKQKV